MDHGFKCHWTCFRDKTSRFTITTSSQKRETRHKGGFLSSATWRLDPWRKAPPLKRGRLAEVAIRRG
jgi:hypothetical protein